MRRKMVRMTQESLTVSALQTHHDFQKEAVLKMIAKRYRVNSVNYHPKNGAILITMRHEGDSKSGCAVFPNGAVSRQNGTIKWDWKRVADSSEATIPDSFVAGEVK
jgi:hypothetical protein